RDQRSRRTTMTIATIVTVLMLGAGLTVLRSWLEPHEHPWRFIIYWLVCAWNTILIFLLALLDLLVVRAEARAARRALRQNFVPETTPEPAPPPDS
ncbi:MAG TPA: hypothetical protein VJ063_04025, partial [Verrucomicrobiae bacterium]|nr:hypothetical protein [Verrucomicrobiae bacterium]